MLSPGAFVNRNADPLERACCDFCEVGQGEIMGLQSAPS